MRTVVRSTSRSRRAFCPADPHAVHPPARTRARPDGHTDEGADRVPRNVVGVLSIQRRFALCLTIDKPFFTAFICGQCLDNVHGNADWKSCFEVGGSNMTTDAP